MSYPTPEQLARIKEATAKNALLREQEPGFKELFEVGLDVSGIIRTPETEIALLRLFTFAVGIGSYAAKEKS